MFSANPKIMETAEDRAFLRKSYIYIMEVQIAGKIYQQSFRGFVSRFQKKCLLFWLVVWVPFLAFSHILGMSSSQLTHIFQRGKKNHQPVFHGSSGSFAHDHAARWLMIFVHVHPFKGVPVAISSQRFWSWPLLDPCFRWFLFFHAIRFYTQSFSESERHIVACTSGTITLRWP